MRTIKKLSSQYKSTNLNVFAYFIQYSVDLAKQTSHYNKRKSVSLPHPDPEPVHGNPYLSNTFPCDPMHCHPTITILGLSLSDMSTNVSASWLSYRNSTSQYPTSFNGSVYGSIIRSFLLRNIPRSRLIEVTKALHHGCHIFPR
jgi:hypothetical protein